MASDNTSPVARSETLNAKLYSISIGQSEDNSSAHISWLTATSEVSP